MLRKKGNARDDINFSYGTEASAEAKQREEKVLKDICLNQRVVYELAVTCPASTRKGIKKKKKNESPHTGQRYAEDCTNSKCFCDGRI